MKKIHNIETTNFKKLTEFLNEKHKSCKGTEYDQLLKEFENKKTELKFQDKKIDELSELVETQQKKIEKFGFVEEGETFD